MHDYKIGIQKKYLLTVLKLTSELNFGRFLLCCIIFTSSFNERSCEMSNVTVAAKPQTSKKNAIACILS